MNKYLKSASERFLKIQKTPVLISPISKVDGEIITEIIEYAKKKGLSELQTILESYKFRKDEEIYESLLELNTNTKQPDRTSLGKAIVDKVMKELIEEPEDEFYDLWLEINGKNMEVKYIHCFESVVDITDEGECVFSIIINKTDEDIKTVPLYRNTVINCKDEEEQIELMKFISDTIEEDKNKIKKWKDENN